MLNATIEKALNEQLNWELYSAYIYYSMSAYCQSVDLTGMANWFKAQTQEEIFHASKFFDYINDRGGRVTLTAIEAPQVEWASPLAAFENALEHEQGVTARINNLVELSVKEKDRTTESFLQWFVTEQIEEEASVSEIIGQLKIIGSSGSGLFMVDRELSTRVFTMPPAGE
jgi:ferritin